MTNYHFKVGIIGTGWVGSSLAISLLRHGLVHELLLNDTNRKLAEGEALDLQHASALWPPTSVKVSEIDAMLDCEILIIAAGRRGRPGESRLELLEENLSSAHSIARQLTSFKGILLVVSNPVDVLTYYFQQWTDLPPTKVIGTGTSLDVLRLQFLLGQKLKADPGDFEVEVLGEHGESAMVVWSRARLAGQYLTERHGWNKAQEEELSQQMRTAAQEIIRRKGATNHAIAMITTELVRCILTGERRVFNLSTVQQGAHDLKNVALSLPSVLGRRGISRVLEIPLSEKEKASLQHSAQKLREVIQARHSS